MIFSTPPAEVDIDALITEIENSKAKDTLPVPLTSVERLKQALEREKQDEKVDNKMNLHKFTGVLEGLSRACWKDQDVKGVRWRWRFGYRRDCPDRTQTETWALAVWVRSGQSRTHRGMHQGQDSWHPESRVMNSTEDMVHHRSCLCVSVPTS